MTRLLENPVFLLLTTGILLGFNFPLGKLATDAHISPILWALVVSLGASGLLLPLLIIRRQFVWPNRHTLRYILISAPISYVIPNALAFSLIEHVGAGYMGLMFALSPVFTLSLATFLGMSKPSKYALMGVFIGLIGAVVVSLGKGSLPDAPDIIWIALALCVPFSLAIGNIYRTWDWPGESAPDALAFWSHITALFAFVVLIASTSSETSFSQMSYAPGIVIIQLVVSGLTFPAFFRLQKVGGPVLLSQIGYVAAAIGLICATFFLGESYTLTTWSGAGLIALATFITIRDQMKKQKN